MKSNISKRIYIAITAITIVIISITVTHYIKLKEEKDKKVQSYIELGHNHFLKGEVDKSYEDYQNAWSLKPRVTNPMERNAALNLAQIMMSRGDMKGAHALLYYNMAEALLLKGDKDGAKKHLEKFLAIAGKDKRLEGIAAKARGRMAGLK